MNDIARVGTALLGLFFLASGVASWCYQAVALGAVGATIPSLNLSVWDILSNSWIILLGNWAPGFSLLLLSRYINFAELESVEGTILPGPQWLVLGIVLLGVYFAALGIASMISSLLAILSVAFLPSNSLELTVQVHRIVTPAIYIAAGMTMSMRASWIASKL